MAQQKRILVADDDAELLSLVKFYLVKQGYEIATVTDGEALLQRAMKESFDLIILDVVMPKMDGYHVTQKLTEDLGARCPKVIIMTSRDLNKEEKIAYASGASAVIQKPLRLVELKAEVEKLIK